MYKLPMKDAYTMMKIRANIEEMLMKITRKAWKQGKSEHETFMVLDNIIDFCELIDVYDEHELRNKFVTMLAEDIVKRNENRKKEH